MKKTLITGVLFANVIFCSSAIAGTGICQSFGKNPAPTADKCLCEYGQPLGSCFSRLGERAGEFPTVWKVTQPGSLYGWELTLSPSNDQMFLTYMGQAIGVFPVTIQSAIAWRHRSDDLGDYFFTGEASFYLDQVLFTLKHFVERKHNEYLRHKEICVGDLCYVSN